MKRVAQSAIQNQLLTQEQVTTFHRDGLLIVPGFYDLHQEIEPIQFYIYQIIGLLIEKYQLPIYRKSFSPDNFDSGYQEMIKCDRNLGAIVYDAVKQIPAFVQLVSSSKNQLLFQQLRATDMPGIAAGGNGIRIDNPYEEKFRAPWHQDYPAQLRSPDGLVFWSPLVPITPEIGPVKFCLGSHQDGLRNLFAEDKEQPLKSGAYALRMIDEENIINQYPQIAPLTQPGDLVAIDFLTIHTSGFNMSHRSRWSMQFRYFNFKNSGGITIDWKGSFAAGIKLQDVHPELITHEGKDVV